MLDETEKLKKQDDEQRFNQEFDDKVAANMTAYMLTASMQHNFAMTGNIYGVHNLR